MRGGYDLFSLVDVIKGPTYNSDIHKNKSHNLHNYKRYFYRYYQTGNTTNPH